MRLAHILPIAALAIVAGCGRSHPESDAADAAALPSIAARVHVVKREQVPVTTEVAGTVRAEQRAQIAARLMGAIAEMPVSLGQKVSAGDVMVKLAADEVSARVAQARSRLNTAQRDLERERALHAKGASTGETVANLEDRVTTGEAELREAETMLSYAVLRAPFDGVVTRKLADVGDLASPGNPILELDGVGAFEVHTGVPESLASKLSLGATVPVEIPATSVSFVGKLVELSSAADADARTVAIEIAVPPDADVHSGQFARVKIPGEPRASIRVPESAVSMFGQMERVFVVSADGRASLRLVKTGARHEARIEIISGLAEGERVILAPPAGMKDGQPVEAQQ